MQHIDRRLLYTDRAYRFKYVTDFIEFGEKDLAAIRAIREPLLDLVPAIVDAVYDKLFSYDITKALFMTPRVTDYDGDYPANLADFGLDHPLMSKRKDHLGRYLRMVISGELNEALPMYMELVGKVHNGWQRDGNVRKAGKKGRDRLHIDYVHINGLFGWLNSFVSSTLIDSGLPIRQVEGAVAAFTRIFWLQNDFFARQYVTMDWTENDEAAAAGEEPAAPSKASSPPAPGLSEEAASSELRPTTNSVVVAPSPGGLRTDVATLAAVGIGSLLVGILVARLIDR